jgi:hypothetical protein
MNDERTHVLQMLANGKITVDEAEALLTALETGDQSQQPFTFPAGVHPQPPQPPRPPQPPVPPQPWRGAPRPRRERSGDDLIDQVLALRIHGIDAKFITAIKELGLGDNTIDEWIALKNHDVTAEFVEEMRAAGLEKLNPDELLQLRIHGVDAAFVQAMREAPGRDLTADQLVALRIHDVTPDVFAEILNLGLTGSKPEKSAG